MSDTHPDARQRSKRVVAPTLLASIYLVVLTFVVGLASIVLLSTTLTQSRIATVAVDGTALGIRKLDYLGRRVIETREAIAKTQPKLKELESKENDASNELTRAKDALNAAKTEIEVQLEKFYHLIEGSEPQLATAIHNKGYQDQVGSILGAKARLHMNHPELDDIVATIDQDYTAYRKADVAATTAQDALKLAQKQVKDFQDANAKTENAVFFSIKDNMDKETRARIEAAFYELNVECSMAKCNGGRLSYWSYQLLTIPSDMLILFLVLLMGLLGSTLQVTHAYFMRHEAHSVGGYFQRLAVGGMTALVIFIVAKAGVPVLTDPAKLGGDAPINPYFISFLAIVSGLLSENAIVNIQAQGARLFGSSSNEPDRWVQVDLTPDLQTQNLSIAKLADYLAVSEAVAGDMIKGKEKITVPQQSIIALYMRREPREIFTDIPPSSEK